MDKIIKRIVIMFTIIFMCSANIFSVPTFANINSTCDSQNRYIAYLEKFNSKYEIFIQRFKSLPADKQDKILDVLKNGGKLEVRVRNTSDKSGIYERVAQRSVSYEADFGLFGITFVTVRLEGRFTYSGSKVKKVKYKNAYIVKNLVPLSGFERTSLDAYVNNGKFNASAAFTAYVGAKIGDNVIGVHPRTFYIEYTCDGYGIGEGNAW